MVDHDAEGERIRLDVLRRQETNLNTTRVRKAAVILLASRLPETLPADLFRAALAALDPARRERLRSYRRMEDLLRGLIGDALASVLLPTGARGGVLHRGPSRRPIPVVPGRHISVAHSGRWIVVAAHGTPVGVDVEQVRAVRATFARGAFGAREIVALAGRADRNLWMLRAWVAKEAVLKRRGRGLSSDPRSLVVSDPGGAVALVRVPGTARCDTVALSSLDEHLFAVSPARDVPPAPRLVDAHVALAALVGHSRADQRRVIPNPLDSARSADERQSHDRAVE